MFNEAMIREILLTSSVTCCNNNEEKIANDSPDDGTASPANDCSL